MTNCARRIIRRAKWKCVAELRRVRRRFRRGHHRPPWQVTQEVMAGDNSASPEPKQSWIWKRSRPKLLGLIWEQQSECLDAQLCPCAYTAGLGIRNPPNWYVKGDCNSVWGPVGSSIFVKWRIPAIHLLSTSRAGTFPPAVT